MEKSPFDKVSDFIANIEHVLFLMLNSANFFYIGEQILFMLPW